MGFGVAHGTPHDDSTLLCIPCNRCDHCPTYHGNKGCVVLGCRCKLQVDRAPDWRPHAHPGGYALDEKKLRRTK